MVVQVASGETYLCLGLGTLAELLTDEIQIFFIKLCLLFTIAMFSLSFVNGTHIAI